ncbi:MAG: hypothetical protein WC683_02220 [bacterium]
MTYLLAIWAWISAHPLEVAVIAWAIFNVAWAQLPQPKNHTMARVWNGLHAALLLVVTPAMSKGTFKLPWLLDVIVKALLSAQKASPAAPLSDDKPTAKDAGNNDGPSGTS